MSLNCDDLPEVNVWPRKNKMSISRIHGKAIGLPILVEAENEAGDEMPAEESARYWQCPACTLLNQDYRLCCEACNAARSSTLARSQDQQDNNSEQAFVNVSAPSLDWPALPPKGFPMRDVAESWIDCEVSSVASSWIDVGGVDEQLDDDDIGAVVVAELAEESKPAKIPLWSAIVGSKADATACAVPATVASTLSRRPPVRRCPKVYETEEENSLLEHLEARRMSGMGGVGKVRRSGRKKRC